MKRTTLLLVIGLALSGCGEAPPTTNECHNWKHVQYWERSYGPFWTFTRADICIVSEEVTNSPVH